MSQCTRCGSAPLRTAWLLGSSSEHKAGVTVSASDGLTRTGTRLFWRVEESDLPRSPPPTIPRLELAATGLLLAYGIAMTVAAEPVLRYTGASSDLQLLQNTVESDLGGFQFGVGARIRF